MQAAADEHHARLARARRQVGERGVRRRRPRRVRREVALVGLRQRGPGLLRALAPVRAAGRLRRVRGAVRRAHRGDRGRRAARRATEMGPLISSGQRQTSLDYLAIGIERGSAPRDRRRHPDGDPGRLLHATGGARRRRQRLARRPGGDLRPGRLHDPVRHRGGSRRGSRTTRRSGSRARSGRATSAARSGSPRASAPGTSA